MSKVAAGQFATLDGLRGVGALTVVTGHSALFFNNINLTGGGPALVDAFFFLSGFVIAYVYEPRFVKGMDARTFMVQRLIRLMPLAMLGTILGYITLAACVTIFQGDISHAAMFSRLIPEMFMIPAMSLGTNDDLFKFNVPLWSLLFELLANVIYVIMIPWLSRRVLVITVAFWAMILALLSIMYGTTDGGAELANAPIGMARASFGFFAGVLLYRMLGSPAGPSKRTGWLALLPMALVIVVAVLPAEGQARPYIQLAAVMLFPIVMISIGSLIEPPQFLQGFFRWAGEMSFPIYVFHWPILMVFRYYEDANPGSLTSLGPIVGIALIAIVVLVSWLLMQFVEVPMRNWLTQLSRRYPAQPRPPQPAAVVAPAASPIRPAE